MLLAQPFRPPHDAINLYNVGLASLTYPHTTEFIILYLGGSKSIEKLTKESWIRTIKGTRQQTHPFC